MTHLASLINEFGVCTGQNFMTNSPKNMSTFEQLDNNFLSLSINDKCARSLYPAEVDDGFCENPADPRTA